MYKVVQNQRNGEKDVSFSWGFDLTFTIVFHKISFDNIVCFFETISVLVPISASMVKSHVFINTDFEEFIFQNMDFEVFYM